MAKVQTTVENMNSPNDAFAVLKLVCSDIDLSINLNTVSIKNFHHRIYLNLVDDDGHCEICDLESVLNRFFRGRPEFLITEGEGGVTIVKR